MIEPAFVEARWKDAWGDPTNEATLENVRDKHAPMVMRTRGWLLLEDDEGASIFNEFSENDQTYRGRNFIPRGMIISITPLRITKPPKPKKQKQESPPGLTS